MAEIIYLFQNRAIILDNYTIQGHLQQNKDRLNIHWDTLTICQLECSYCYARNLKGKEWGKFTPKKTIDKIIDALSKSYLPFNLGLLGGEPTIGPYYNYIIDKVLSLDKINKIYVTTNAEKDLSTIRTSDIAFLFSYHPADCTSDENFLKNVKYIIQQGNQLKVNIILHPNKKFWEKSLNMAKEIMNLNVKIHPHFLHSLWERKLYRYNKELWNYFSIFKDLEKDICFNEDKFNDYEVYKNGLTKFKGWSCYNNNYEIDVEGKVVQFCRTENTSTIDLTKDSDFFEKITAIEPMFCPYNECNCDGLLKLKKTRN